MASVCVCGGCGSQRAGTSVTSTNTSMLAFLAKLVATQRYVPLSPTVALVTSTREVVPGLPDGATILKFPFAESLSSSASRNQEMAGLGWPITSHVIVKLTPSVISAGVTVSVAIAGMAIYKRGDKITMLLYSRNVFFVW